MRVSSHRFARALAERIGEILPPSVAIRAEGSTLRFEADGVSWGGTGMAETVEGELDADHVETAARAVLSGIQDFTAEHLALPWPADADGSMAEADARVDADRIHLWFGGSEDSALLPLRPIELNEIAG